MAFCNKGKGFCVGCSFRTIEKKQFNVDTNSKCFQRTLTTLKCSRCSRELCYDCVEELLNNIKSKEHLFHEVCNDFVQGLKIYQKSKGKVTPEGFIGHCCLIDQHYPSKINRAQDDRNKTNTLFFQREHLPTALVPQFFKAEHAMSDNVPHLGGCMCLPEYKLLLPSNERSMDILGLGKEGDALQPKWHYVIDEKLAAEMREREVKPSTAMPETWININVNIRVPLPHSLKSKKKLFKVRVYYVPKLRDEDITLKGTNDITEADLSTSFYFDVSSNVSNDIDVTLVVGLDASDHGSILLMRFHKLKPSFRGNNPCLSTKNFLSNLQKELKNGGLERRRVGGSSGTITYSENVKLLLATPNSTPRCASGAVWLRDKDNLKLHVFYFGTQDAKNKYFYYTTPRHGGSFEMPLQYYKEYPFLQDFASTKPLAATIVHGLQKTLQHNANAPRVLVCPAAVKEEMKNMEAARAFVSEMLKNNEMNEYNRKILFYQFYSVNFLNYTLVMHPVGRHLDVFADGKPSLENRICFSFSLQRDGSSGLKNTGEKLGRGGGGLHRFSFALLDWTSNNRNRRRIWTDPANRHLPDSAADYGNRNGDGRQRLTRTIWDHFALNGNRITLPRNVTLRGLRYRNPYRVVNRNEG